MFWVKGQGTAASKRCKNTVIINVHCQEILFGKITTQGLSNCVQHPYPWAANSDSGLVSELRILQLETQPWSWCSIFYKYPHMRCAVYECIFHVKEGEK